MQTSDRWGRAAWATSAESSAGGVRGLLRRVGLEPGWLPAMAVLLLPILPGCPGPQCYSSSDCADGSTCCGGMCTAVQPLPIGPAACETACECETFMDDDLERSLCFYYEGSGTTQCTRTCEIDSDCVTADGLEGRCIERDEAALVSRLCVWEAS